MNNRSPSQSKTKVNLGNSLAVLGLPTAKGEEKVGEEPGSALALKGFQSLAERDRDSVQPTGWSGGMGRLNDLPKPDSMLAFL